MKNSISYAVALRIKQNCLNNSDLSKRCEEYKRYLMFQDYPKSSIEKEFDKALKVNSKNLLHVKVKPKRNVYPFVTEFNPRTPSISQIISKHMHLISTSELKENFPNKSIITAYSRGGKCIGPRDQWPQKIFGVARKYSEAKELLARHKDKFFIGRKYTELENDKN